MWHDHTFNYIGEHIGMERNFKYPSTTHWYKLKGLLIVFGEENVCQE